MTESFDIAALTYDEDFTDSLTGKLQRSRVWQYLDPLLSAAPMHVLELNCGTGEDALHIAQRGHCVTATDISENMLSAARHKVSNGGLSAKVRFQKADLTQLNELNQEGSYDLIFSNFGGVNCVSPEAMEALAQEAGKLLKPGGKLVMVIMPRFCLWETLYFLLKGKPKDAFRRRKDFSMANVSGEMVKTWYYSSQQVKRRFKAYFKSTRVKPVGLFGPPSYLEALMRRNKLLFQLMSVLENSLASFGWQSNMADHFYLEMEVKRP